MGKVSALLERGQRGLAAYCIACADVSSHLVHYQCLPGEYYLCWPVQRLLTWTKQGEYIPTGKSSPYPQGLLFTKTMKSIR